MNHRVLPVLSAFALLVTASADANERMNYGGVSFDIAQVDSDLGTLTGNAFNFGIEFSEHFYGGFSVEKTSGKNASLFDSHGFTAYIGGAIELEHNLDAYATISTNRTEMKYRAYFNNSTPQTTNYSIGLKKGIGNFVGTFSYSDTLSDDGIDSDGFFSVSGRFYSGDNYYFGASLAEIEGDYAQAITFGKTF